jgi:hypothetical protein
MHAQLPKETLVKECEAQAVSDALAPLPEFGIDDVV